MSSKKVALAVVCLSAIFGRSADAAVIYDLGAFPLTGFGFTDVDATLETTITGVFTSEADIENFFNVSPYTITVTDGSITRFVLDNGNSDWDLRFGGNGTSVVLAVTPNEITLSFFTPDEVSQVALLLRNAVTFDNWQYGQFNNVTDGNFVLFSDGQLVNADGAATIPFGDPFILPALSSGVPEPSTFLLLSTVLIGLSKCTRRRHQ